MYSSNTAGQHFWVGYGDVKVKIRPRAIETQFHCIKVSRNTHKKKTGEKD